LLLKKEIWASASPDFHISMIAISGSWRTNEFPMQETISIIAYLSNSVKSIKVVVAFFATTTYFQQSP
jgi:hypothetical protein